MTAGKGIVHSERTPEYLRHTDKLMHGLQIWVALPEALEQMEPTFFHASENELPAWENNGVSYKLIAGNAFNRISPVPVYSKLYFLELTATQKQSIKLGHELFGEVGIYILEGTIESDGHSYEPRRILVAKEAELCEIILNTGTTIYIFGGDPFPEERLIYWNFVAIRQELDR